MIWGYPYFRKPPFVVYSWGWFKLVRNALTLTHKKHVQPAEL